MTKTAVFDLDGTLVDTAPDLLASLNVCLAAAGLPDTSLEVVRPHAGHGSRVMLQHAYARAGRPLEESEAEAQVARFLQHYEANICVRSRPLVGVEAAMDRLSAAGYTLAVCTNKLEHLSVKLLGALGLSNRFTAVCGADTFPRRKPDPAHLLGTIERAGGTPTFAVMIGDTATDTDAAIAARIPSILVDFGYAPDARARVAATRIVETYDEVDADLCDGLIADGQGSQRPY